MLTFHGRVKILAGTFKTLQELIIAAINARTYVSAGAKARDLSMWRGQIASRLKIKAIDGNLYVADSWKGNANGVITQSAWVAGDMTAAPGGAEVLDGGVEYILANVQLANRMAYSVADNEIAVEATCAPILG